MRIIVITITVAAILLTGCTTLGRFHARAIAHTERDAENAALVLAKAGPDPAVNRCVAATFAFVERAPDPALATGKLSKAAVWRAYRRLYEEKRSGCAELEVAVRGKVERLLGMIGGTPFGF